MTEILVVLLFAFLLYLAFRNLFWIVVVVVLLLL